ncbi:universal stress protein [Gordonia sp. CPCC 205515]|uniref:universal stress protein n=1 Tax=Gordonia sp. CPCC 205515 TaxID=3140791 RepID=UPI003AF36C15
MTIVVGYPTNRRAKAVLSLAGMIARSTGEDIVVCTTIRDPRIPGIAPDHPEVRSYVDELADKALELAREDMPTDIRAHYVRVNAESVARGLIGAAGEYQASMIVVGSATGRVEQVTIGSIADRVLHSAPVPVAVATRGFRANYGKVTRVNLAFKGGTLGPVHVAAAEELAGRLGAQLRLVSFAVHLSPPAAMRVPFEGPSVFESWHKAIHHDVTAAIDADAATAHRKPEFVIGEGRDWQDALDSVTWDDGDLLVVGSSDAGPVARVFVGSHASKIIRHSPVPVIAIPRASAAELAAD